MATFTANVETTRTADESFRTIVGYLRANGYAPKGDRSRSEWRKGVYWVRYVTFDVADGKAAVRAWINLPYPGMGSYLKYFLGRNELKKMVSELEVALGRNGELPAFAAPAGASYAGAPDEPPEDDSSAVASASFARRAAALVVDVVAVQLAAVPLLALLMLLARGEGARAGGHIALAALLLVSWSYFAGFESSRHQATWGKRLLGVKVCDLQCRRITLARASGRFFGKLVSALVYGIGFLIALGNRRKQALHDLMAGTLVVVR